MAELREDENPLADTDDGAELADFAALPTEVAYARIDLGYRNRDRFSPVHDRLQEDLAVWFLHIAVEVDDRLLLLRRHPGEIRRHDTPEVDEKK